MNAPQLWSWVLIGAVSLSMLAPTLWSQASLMGPNQSGVRTELANSSRNVEQIVDSVIAREKEQNNILSNYHPVIETYGQDGKMVHDELVVVRDWYLLGIAQAHERLMIQSLLSAKDEPPLKSLISGFNPVGFLQEAYIDRSGFDRQHYEFKFAGREFLGAVRCVMFDVTPLPRTGKGRFKGRIWAEDEHFTIVRFSGAYYPLHEWKWDHVVLPSQWQNPPFDSWRVNVQPDLWLPAYIFSQDLSDKSLIHRAQTRLWGYNRQDIRRQSEFADLSVQSPALSRDMGDAEEDRSPLETQRQWRSEAEQNAVETLQRAGLIAPRGAVEKILDAIVNNLEVSNKLTLEPEIRCRILTTGNLEIFFIGRTLILSRGLIDVLPDEATLAAVVAQGVGRIVTTGSAADRYGFGDTMQMSPKNIVRGFRAQETKQQLEKANDYALALLNNSPYKSGIGNAALFLKQLKVTSKSLIELTHPIWGNGVSTAFDAMNLVPILEADRSGEVIALPIGGRLKLDPWNDGVSLLQAPRLQLFSSREKIPFGMTPFVPFLKRYQEPTEGAPSGH